MILYLVKKITEEDFGCEGRPDGYEPMVRVDLRAVDHDNPNPVPIGDGFGFLVYLC